MHVAMNEFSRISLFIASFSLITSTILVRLTSSQPVNRLQSYTAIVDPVNKSALCATDPPATVVPVSDVSVGVPVGVPDAVVCGLCCTGNRGCISYNYRKSRSNPAQCELYSTVPRNCSTLATADGICQPYEVSGLKRSCLPPEVTTTVQPTTAPLTTHPATSSVTTTSHPKTTVIISKPFPTASACTGPNSTFYNFPYAYSDYLFSVPKVDQPTAKRNCLSCGAQLTSIGSQGEYDFILSKLNVYRTDAWIGLEKDKPEGLDPNHVHWLDGSNVTYLNWVTGEPDENNTVCIRFSVGANAVGYKDRSCTGLFNYVCKKPAK